MADPDDTNLIGNRLASISIHTNNRQFAGKFSMPLGDIGIVPLVICFPFLYFPKVLEGDTQLWVFAAAVFAVLTFRINRFIKQSDILLYFVVFLCVLAYALRFVNAFDLFRYIYTLLTFILLWILCQRGGDEYFSFAIKWTVLLWFLVGLYQFLSIKMGISIDFSGRYVPGRSGVPSLTAEPSFYGTLTVIQIMYLLGERKRGNIPYVLLGFFSVFLSGSLLAFLFLVFPLIKIIQVSRWGVLFVAIFVVFGSVYFTLNELPARLSQLVSSGTNLQMLFLDPSINLRAGHVYFTLFGNFPESLVPLDPIDFMAQYNYFASESVVFRETNSDYILPALGELVYGSGIFAVVVLGILLFKAQGTCRSWSGKALKVIVVLACLLNPIHISNLFLITYALKKE